ncbi:hypothetical protein [Actinopolymorpha cephalotaxi]|uniref:Uncharacterized protein n=1 Tax=Actinopolymorpha cephalotaxi TaxID=504797 RepID=A0ABX2S659_9ACTN|nr:hypothetical protein [Actinopolymorpha cephalotaxi]NYH85118.1 hypothetical protein [Actinopolymorpha cephalotaxi]
MTAAVNEPPRPLPHLVTICEQSVTLAVAEGTEARLHVGEARDGWVLMATVHGRRGGDVAVFEDFTSTTGPIAVVGQDGTARILGKSLEPTFAEAGSLYHGHDARTVLSSDTDLLGEEILAEPGDPSYADVAACFPPIAKPANSSISAMATYTFVATPSCRDKIGVAYGGRTANFDPAVYVPAIAAIRERGEVLDGLVGGWPPVLRFVYPEGEGTWSELVMFAPFRTDNGNERIQPVWHRIARVENGELAWVKYVDSYPPVPPRTTVDRADDFFADLLDTVRGWEDLLADATDIDVPDQRLADQARHSLARAMSTRIGDFPKYGVMDRAYGGAEHDGFQDTFNVDVTAMLDWGLFDAARRYVDNYLTNFVRDDGSIVYRGPGTGQYGRMLTVLAHYFRLTRDDDLLRRHRPRIDAIATVLLGLRATAKSLPDNDPGHGLIAGWSEADSCLEADPDRYVRPYLSNSSEAVRGFADLGAVWEELGETHRDDGLTAWGERLRDESTALLADLRTAVDRSMLTDVQPPCLPSIAGVEEPFHVAVQRDNVDPQFRAYRVNSELLHSGVLDGDAVDTIVRYRAAHRDIRLGVPMAYGFDSWDDLGGNGGEMAGFLSYGHAYGLLQHDRIREFLLALYSLSAHQYTRGSWTAPETRSVHPDRPAAPYAVPAQLVVPLLTRWMLAFEEPFEDVLWLCRATPRDWLRDGGRISARGVPTRWGKVDVTVDSRVAHGRVDVEVRLPEKAAVPLTRIRLRLPDGLRIVAASVVDNGAPVPFDAESETVTLPADRGGHVRLTVAVSAVSAE